MENLGVWSDGVGENSEVSSPSFPFWVQCKMENSELKTSENWFSEVSEFSENFEFSTSPDIAKTLNYQIAEWTEQIKDQVFGHKLFYWIDTILISANVTALFNWQKGYYIDSIIKLLIQENQYDCGKTSLKTLKNNHKTTVIHSLQLFNCWGAGGKFRILEWFNLESNEFPISCCRHIWIISAPLMTLKQCQVSCLF